MRAASVVLAAVVVALAGPSPAAPDRSCGFDVAPEAKRGDLDGDGRVERIWIAGGRRLGLGCRHVLRAHGASGHWATPVVSDVATPTIPSVRNLDGRPGAEVDVVVARGAATAISEVYGVRGGVFRKFAFGASTRVVTFSSAGMSFGGADCVLGRPGTIVLVSVVRGRSSFGVTKSTWRADGLRFRQVARSERRVTRPPRVGMSFESCPR